MAYKWNQMVEKAYEYAKSQSWENRVQEWLKLIQ